MKTQTRLFSLALALQSLSLGAAFAATEEYAIDAGHSAVKFQIRHMMAETDGRFQVYDGAFQWDEATNELKSLNFKVDVSSIDTDNAKRDEHLKSPDFFDVQNHKEASFTMKEFKRISKKGQKASADTPIEYKMMGDLTIKGITKPATFKVFYFGQGTDPWGNEKTGFKAETELNRKDFGLTWNKPVVGGLILGDKVKLTVNIEANKKKASDKKS